MEVYCFFTIQLSPDKYLLTIPTEQAKKRMESIKNEEMDEIFAMVQNETKIFIYA